MKAVEKYVDEISGREFKTKADAIKSEKKNGGIKKLFSFWTMPKDDGTCSFANGEWCYQRTDVDYLRLQESLIKAVKDYEPWIYGQYKDGLTREHMKGGYMIGRYLDDNHSELYSWYRILSNVCQNCFREWGQPYYATNCKHNTTPRVIQATPPQVKGHSNGE